MMSICPVPGIHDLVPEGREFPIHADDAHCLRDVGRVFSGRKPRSVPHAMSSFASDEKYVVTGEEFEKML